MNTPWTAEEDARLRVLWDGPMSTQEIGVEMNRGKNAVIGRSKRLQLPNRPNPLVFAYRKSGAAGRERVASMPDPRRDDVIGLLRQGMSLRDIAARCDASEYKIRAWVYQARKAGNAPKITKGPRRCGALYEVRKNPVRSGPVRVVMSDRDGCRYLIDLPDGRVRYCDEPIVRGPYCAPCSSRCYRPRAA